MNNAGLSFSKSLLETTEADWDLQHDVMAKGSFLVAQAAARVMIDQRMGGDIVYITSKNAVFAGPDNIAYSATKADQAHQVRLLAVELGEHGIRVNGVNPDGVVRGSGIFAGGWGASARPPTASPRRTSASSTPNGRSSSAGYCQNTSPPPSPPSPAMICFGPPGSTSPSIPASPPPSFAEFSVTELVAAVDCGATSVRRLLHRSGRPDAHHGGGSICV